MIEKETGKKLICHRYNNGGEYNSREFEVYCTTNGLRHEKTISITPRHNGVAERMNHSTSLTGIGVC